MPRVAELKDQVGRIWFASFHTDLADTLSQQLRQHALVGVQTALEAALREEVADYGGSVCQDTFQPLIRACSTAKD